MSYYICSMSCDPPPEIYDMCPMKCGIVAYRLDVPLIVRDHEGVKTN